MHLAEGRLGGPRPRPSWAQAWPPLVSRWKVACLPSPQQRKKVARKKCISAWLEWSMVMVKLGLVKAGAKLPPPRTSWRRWSLCIHGHGPGLVAVAAREDEC